ncbi:acidocalcisomal exopolyphosphatase, putative [Bodo saltans]|uniref:Acidocalcisomal exopolyphosphatase, putative n=1 Tax=Bodo saltans TaxID=75058 RepID=A0A0S4IZ18_BODSA|nr:acidocalcisomal exopolyphosphatase, putative [Bodo saltans]|eukprot:CUG62141.1 acidocalcisomal exopolyphosphatase, putative [Bodo saltans]
MISQFLYRCKAAIAAGQLHPKIVLGNEGGDMDSIVGSVYLAYLLTQVDGGDDPVVPYLNFILDDVPLRNDVVKLLAEEGIDTALFQSVVQSPSELALPARCSEITLFDHNVLAPHQREWDALVKRVVDHHVDEQRYPSQCTLYEVAAVGSASTLVVELFDRRNVAIPSPKVLLAPIVLDTMNFDVKHKKVTPRDVAARDRLIRDIPELQQQGSIDAWFDTLNEWKNDTTQLTPPQCLRRDYKRFEFTDAKVQNWRVGISSVPVLQNGIHALYTPEKWIAACSAFRAERDLDVLAVMYAGENTDGLFSRELEVFLPSHIIGMFEHFAEVTDCTIGLALQESAESCASLARLFYTQRDGAVSRKKFTPLLSDAIAKFSPKL